MSNFSKRYIIPKLVFMVIVCIRFMTGASFFFNNKYPFLCGIPISISNKVLEVLIRVIKILKNKNYRF